MKKNHTSYTSVNGAHIYLCHSCNHFLKISAAEKASLNSKVSWNVRLLLLLLPSTTVWANLFPPLYKSVLCVPWCTHTLLCHSAVRAQWVRLLAFAGSGHLWAIPPVPVASRHGQKNLSDTWRVPTLISHSGKRLEECRNCPQSKVALVTANLRSGDQVCHS